MKIIVAAIEYNTPELIETFINKWSVHESVVKIYIGSTTINKSSKKFKLLKQFNDIEIYYTDLVNNGYGSALDNLINMIKIDIQYDLKNINYLFIGNIDVYPIKIIEPGYLLDQSKIPVFNIIENGRNRNPFVTQLQKHFLFLYKLPLKFHSSNCLYVVILFMKIIKLLKSRTWAVHGSFFCFNLNLLYSSNNYFNKSFLYCEELFYARNVEKINIELVDSQITLEHLGGVSTSKLIKRDKKKFFKFWKESMNEYYLSEHS